MLVVTELHYHRNGVFGDGYYAGRAEWTPEDETFRVMFVAFLREDHGPEGRIAIMADDDVSVSFRYEDFKSGLCRFIDSRGGQALAFPHTIVQHA